MTTIRAAKYLNGSDIGKQFTIQGFPEPRIILDFHHYLTRVEVSCVHPSGDKLVHTLLLAEEEITLQGRPSPRTDDPHGINTKGR